MPKIAAPRVGRPLAAVLLVAMVGWGVAPGVFARESRSQLRTAIPYHVVEPGENLYRIALKYDVDLKDLCEVNGITDPSTVEKGQRLRLPRKKQTRVGMYHVVEAGETLPAIADAYHFSARSLASLNRIRTDSQLRKGQMIWVPGAMERQSVGRATAVTPTARPERGVDFQQPQRPGNRRETTRPRRRRPSGA